MAAISFFAVSMMVTEPFSSGNFFLLTPFPSLTQTRYLPSLLSARLRVFQAIGIVFSFVRESRSITASFDWPAFRKPFAR